MRTQLRSLPPLLLLSVTVLQWHPRICAADSAETTAAAPQADAGSSSTTTSTNGLDSEFFSRKFGPLTVAAGPATAGGFGVSVDGNQAKPLTSLKDNLPETEILSPAWYHAYMGSLGYKVNGLFTTQTGSPNNASISLDPGFDLGYFYGILRRPPKDCKPTKNDDGTYTVCPTILPKSEFGLGLKGDIEYRYGTVKQNGSVSNANQAIVGASVYVVPSVFRSIPWLLVVPQVTASYYKPVTTTTSAITLPSDIKSNYFQTEFHSEVGWDAFGLMAKSSGQYPVALDIKYDGSKPLSGTDRGWQSLWRLQLSVALTGSTLKPALTFQSGTQGGFQYDKEVIFGFVAELLKPQK